MIKETIEKLKARIENTQGKYFFNDPATWDDVNELEDNLNIILPVTFKMFLAHFNGGFISLFDPEKKLDFETNAWNSNTILSLGEMESAYEKIEHKFLDEEVRFIPFLQTNGQEYLAFRWPFKVGTSESKIYDIWHEGFPSEWDSQIVYNDFAELFTEYVNDDGIIQTIG